MGTLRRNGNDLAHPCPHCGAKAGEACWDDPHPKGFWQESPEKKLARVEKLLERWRARGYLISEPVEQGMIDDLARELAGG